MDFIPILSSICIITTIFFAIRALYKNILWSKEYYRIHKERNERYKLMTHLIENRLKKKECICTPECLKQLKDERLRALLPSQPFRVLSRENIGSSFTPRAAAAWIRPTIFIPESTFGAP